MSSWGIQIVLQDKNLGLGVVSTWKIWILMGKKIICGTNNRNVVPTLEMWHLMRPDSNYGSLYLNEAPG